MGQGSVSKLNKTLRLRNKQLENCNDTNLFRMIERDAWLMFHIGNMDGTIIEVTKLEKHLSVYYDITYKKYLKHYPIRDMWYHIKQDVIEKDHVIKMNKARFHYLNIIINEYFIDIERIITNACGVDDISNIVIAYIQHRTMDYNEYSLSLNLIEDKLNKFKDNQHEEATQYGLIEYIHNKYCNIQLISDS